MVFSAGVGWLSASLLPLALNTVPRDHQGTAIGVFGAVEDGGLLIGPLLFGAAWAAYGPRSIFPVVTAVAAVGVVASLLVASRGPAAVRAAVAQGAVARDPD